MKSKNAKSLYRGRPLYTYNRDELCDIIAETQKANIDMATSDHSVYVQNLCLQAQIDQLQNRGLFARIFNL